MHVNGSLSVLGLYHVVPISLAALPLQTFHQLGHLVFSFLSILFEQIKMKLIGRDQKITVKTKQTLLFIERCFVSIWHRRVFSPIENQTSEDISPIRRQF